MLGSMGKACGDYSRGGGGDNGHPLTPCASSEPKTDKHSHIY